MVEAKENKNEKKMDLFDFLDQDNVNDKVYEVPISKRLEDFPFKIKPMNFEQYTRYQQNASNIRKKKVDFDSETFYMEMITEHTIYPNFKDAETLKRFDCFSATELINKKLTVDEVNNLGDAILEISGMKKEFDVLVVRAKNS